KASKSATAPRRWRRSDHGGCRGSSPAAAPGSPWRLTMIKKPRPTITSRRHPTRLVGRHPEFLGPLHAVRLERNPRKQGHCFSRHREEAQPTRSRATGKRPWIASLPSVARNDGGGGVASCF